MYNLNMNFQYVKSFNGCSFYIIDGCHFNDGYFKAFIRTDVSS